MATPTKPNSDAEVKVSKWTRFWHWFRGLQRWKQIVYPILVVLIWKPFTYALMYVLMGGVDDFILIVLACALIIYGFLPKPRNRRSKFKK